MEREQRESPAKHFTKFLSIELFLFAKLVVKYVLEVDIFKVSDKLFLSIPIVSLV